MNPLTKTRESYNTQADWHSRKFDGYDWKKECMKFLGMLQGKKILDAGCGNGRDMQFFSRQGYKVTGIDNSDEMVRRASAQVRDAKVRKMDFLTRLDFKNNEFDGVWASASLLHVPKKSLGGVLAELKRVLKDHGVLFVSVKEGKGEIVVQDDFGEGERFFSFYTEKEIKQRLESHGLEVRKSYRRNDDDVRVGFQKKKGKQVWIIAFAVKEPVNNHK